MKKKCPSLLSGPSILMSTLAQLFQCAFYFVFCLFNNCITDASTGPVRLRDPVWKNGSVAVFVCVEWVCCCFCVCSLGSILSSSFRPIMKRTHAMPTKDETKIVSLNFSYNLDFRKN